MTELALAVCGMQAVVALCQAVGVALLIRRFHEPTPPPATDAELPRAAVLLSLRGADPGLAGSLRRLLRQDYPRYELRIVVDRDDDPAWAMAHTAAREPGVCPVHIEPLRRRPATCSLKCSALLQMVEGLGADCEVVVLADADVAPPAGWLRALVAPLRQAGVGAAFGNRWYMPPAGRWGSLVRYVWNAGAVAPMYLLGIPWGGSFAIQADVLRRSGLVQLWARTIVDDVPARRALGALGLRLEFVPELMMVNREECDLAFGLDFIQRQLMWTRLYHPHWRTVLLHGLGTAATLLAGFGLLGAALAAAAPVAAAVTGASLVGYLLAMLLLIIWLEATVRRTVRSRGEPTDWLSARVLLKLVAALPLTQAVYVTGLLLAQFRRRVRWRGVTYEVRGPWHVRRLDDGPFRAPPQSADPATSL